MDWLLIGEEYGMILGWLDVFRESHLPGKVIVVLLAFVSVVGWSLLIGKALQLKWKKEKNDIFERRLHEMEDVLSLQTEQPRVKSDYSRVFLAAVRAYHRYTVPDDYDEIVFRLAHVNTAIQRILNRVRIEYDSKMPWLAAIIGAAPFTGLLGTVWGVMDAFTGIAAEGSASLQTLAPGVSGALLTTVVALIVAIPSVFGYNLLIGKVNELNSSLENFASSLADRIELEARDRLPKR